VLAVLLDGPAWAARRTVGDRDGLPVEVLGGMLRWPVVERVWLPEWLTAPVAVVDRLVAAVASVPDDAGAADRAPLVATALADIPLADIAPLTDIAPLADISPLADVVPLVPAPAGPPPAETYRGVAALRAVVTEKVAAPVPPPAPKPAPKKAALDGEVTFAPWTPKTAGDKAVLDALPAAASARAVRRVLAAGVKAEGPIHVDRLVRLAAAAFGVTRVTDARRAALLSTLPPSAVEGDWLWPDALDRDSWTAFRRQASGADRPLEHVPPEEIGNAMAAMCRASAGMQRDELLTQAAAVFGYKRRTPTITPLLEAAVDAALAADRLAEQPNGLITA
jgi:hypothetical protein